MLPTLGKPVSPLALGTAWCRNAERDACFRVFDAFREGGGTVFDLARLYGGGESEEVAGAWLQARGCREDTVLITKGGHGDCHGLSPGTFEPTVEAELATSLATLQTDYIDLYMLHRDSPEVPVGRIVEHLNALQARGSFRAYGLSNWTYERLEAARAYAADHDLAPLAAVSNHLSLATPAGPFHPGLIAVDADGARWHVASGIPLVSWSSQARGFFTGRYTPAAVPDPANADAHTRQMLAIYATPANLERLHWAAEIGRKKGDYTAVEVALAWLLHRPFPVLPVIGPRTPAELSSCLRATEITLDHADLAQVPLAGDKF